MIPPAPVNKELAPLEMGLAPEMTKPAPVRKELAPLEMELAPVRKEPVPNGIPLAPLKQDPWKRSWPLRGWSQPL